jgi:DNA adenine methylase
MHDILLTPIRLNELETLIQNSVRKVLKENSTEQSNQAANTSVLNIGNKDVSKMRTPITYYGGKQRLLKELLQLLPEHRHYVEPFMGGGAFFFAKPPSSAETINDLNGEVINFYRVTKNQFEELKKKIDSTLHSRSTYKEALAVYNHLSHADDVTRAWAFWVVTNQGFSGKIGSWALSRDGKIGKTLSNKREQFNPVYAERLKHTQIESKDALAIIKQYDAKDVFFYTDPPYFNSDCGHYKGYTEVDYKNLLDILAKIKGKFLLSSYPSDILKQYIKKYNWHAKEKKQVVSVSCRSKKQKTEVMVYNY